jgi:hypothetical protein
MNRPFVAICVASTGSWKAQMGQCLAQLTMASIAACGLTILIAEGSIVSCRNRLALGALESGASHLLFVDSDNTFPPQGLGRLLLHDKDIVGATYARRREPFTVIGEWTNNGTDLVPATKLPTGFLLIKTDVLKALEPPWFVEPIDWSMRTSNNVIGMTSDDIYFCSKAIVAGFQPWIDLGLTEQVGHIGEIVATCKKN